MKISSSNFMPWKKSLIEELGLIYSLTQARISFYSNGKSGWLLSKSPRLNPSPKSVNVFNFYFIEFILIRRELWKNWFSMWQMTWV